MRLNQGSLMGGKLLAVTDDLIPLQSELTTHKNDTVSHVTQADRNDWSGKETTAGAQAKVNAHSLLTTNPHNVTKSQVGLGNVDNIQQATKSEFNTHAADTALHVTSAKQAAWDAKETPAGAQAKADAAVVSAKGYTDTEVAKLVDSSPETMNTLNELAQALGDDPNFATTMSNEIGTKLPTTTFDAHAGNATHITAAERTSWNSKAAGTHTHAIADTTGLQTALDDRYTKAAANTLYDAKANKTVTLSGGTGITATIGDLSANRTISVDSTVARKDTRSDGYHWFRRSSTAPALYITQQSSGDIAQFLQGAGDGTLRSSIANDGQFTGNAYTASKWNAARTLTVSGDATGSVVFDGSGNIPLNLQVTDDSHSHTILKAADRRTSIPSDFSNMNVGMETIFTTVDNIGSDPPFADALVLSTYVDSSGGGVNMLTFRKDKAEIGHRYGAWNGASWEGYRRLAYADELAWGNLSGVPNEFTPSAHDHDDRYYLKTQVDGFLTGKSDTGHTHTFASLTSKPTTLSGYGITDAASSAHNHDATYLKIAGGTMTGTLTLSTMLKDNRLSTGNTQLLDVGMSGTRIYVGNTATSLMFEGSSIAFNNNGIWHAGNFTPSSKADASHTHTFASLTSKPTTLSGYGITDAAASSHNHDATYLKLTGGIVSGDVEFLDGATVLNPNNVQASAWLSWQNDNFRIRMGGTGIGSSGLFEVQGSGDFKRLTLDSAGHMTLAGSAKATEYKVGTTAVIESDAKVAWDKLKNVPASFSPAEHTHALDSLSDVLMTSKVTNQFIKWNGTKWVNSSLAATDIPSLDALKITSGTFSSARLPAATTSAVGVSQLNDATNSTSTTQAATANAVKKAYDLANAALPKAGGTLTGSLTINGTLNTTGTQIGMSNDANAIVVNDSNNEARTGYYTGADSFTFQLDSNVANTVVKTGHVDVETVYANKQVGVGSMRMEYNTTEQSLDFVFG